MTLSQRVDKAIERSERLTLLHTFLRTYSDLALDIASRRPGTVYVPAHVYAHMRYLQAMIESERPNGAMNWKGIHVLLPDGLITIKVGGAVSRWSAR